jgi:hypothetical protein
MDHDQWIQRWGGSGSVEEHLSAIKSWQARARSVANDAARHGNKQAAQEVEPRPAEAKALHGLYGLWASDIWHTCREMYARWASSRSEDELALSFGDVLQESYVLFQRAMVRAESKFEMLNRLEARLGSYFRTRLVKRPAGSAAERMQSREAGVEPGRLVDTYEKLMEKGRLPDKARTLYRELGLGQDDRT